MRSILRILLVVPLLAALVAFASVHYEESYGPNEPYVRTIEVGVYRPWFTLRHEATHRNRTQYVSEMLARQAREDDGESAVEFTYRYAEHDSWTVDVLAPSMLAGVAFILLAFVYARLGRSRRGPSPPSAPAAAAVSAASGPAPRSNQPVSNQPVSNQPEP